MKTAISIRDDLFERGESAVRRLGISRSELYASALEEYLEKLGPNPVAAQLDELASEFDGEPPVNTGAAIIRQGQWQW